MSKRVASHGHDTDHVIFRWAGGLATLAGVVLLGITAFKEPTSVGHLMIGTGVGLVGLPFLIWGKGGYNGWQARGMVFLALFILAGGCGVLAYFVAR